MISISYYLQKTTVLAKYELKAVTLHYDSAFGGHYHTSIYRDLEWLDCNDESIRLVSFDDVVHVSQWCSTYASFLTITKDENAYALLHHQYDIEFSISASAEDLDLQNLKRV